jgi:hypothetical protein
MDSGPEAAFWVISPIRILYRSFDPSHRPGVTHDAWLLGFLFGPTGAKRSRVYRDLSKTLVFQGLVFAYRGLARCYPVTTSGEGAVHMQGEYHYVRAEFVMRRCKDIDDAIIKFEQLMPKDPDDSTNYMESWAVETVYEPATGVERDVTS